MVAEALLASGYGAIWTTTVRSAPLRCTVSFTSWPIQVTPILLRSSAAHPGSQGGRHQLPENAEYQAAKSEQELNETRIASGIAPPFCTKTVALSR